MNVSPTIAADRNVVQALQQAQPQSPPRANDHDQDDGAASAASPPRPAPRTGQKVDKSA